MKSYTIPTGRQQLAVINRNGNIARQPVITGYGLRGQVEYRESDEPVLVEYDEAHQTDIILVRSKFAHLYYLVAEVAGEWRCTAKEPPVTAQCIEAAQAFLRRDGAA